VEDLVETDLRGLLPDGTRVLSAAGRTRATADMSKAFMTTLTAMSLLALLIGLFLIFNSVNFSVLQRRALIGVLRGLGVTRRQLLALILIEAGLVGTVAAVLGVAFGIVLGEGLLDLVSRSINDLYYRVNVTGVSVGTASNAKGLVAGVGAAHAAAAVPALEAASYPPQLAMTRSTIERRARHVLPKVTMTGVGMMLAAVLLIVISGNNLVAGLAAVFLLMLGFAFCVPLLVRFASTRGAPLAARLGGTSLRLAVAGIAAGLSRTAVAIVALAVAVSATIGISIMVESFRGSVSEWLGQALQADVYAGVARGTLDPALAADFRALEGVVATSTLRRAQLEDANGRTELRAIDSRRRPGAGLARLGEWRRRAGLGVLRVPGRGRCRRRHHDRDGSWRARLRCCGNLPELRCQRQRRDDEPRNLPATLRRRSH